VNNGIRRHLVIHRSPGLSARERERRHVFD